jgi:histone H3/H4
MPSKKAKSAETKSDKKDKSASKKAAVKKEPKAEEDKKTKKALKVKDTPIKKETKAEKKSKKAPSEEKSSSGGGAGGSSKPKITSGTLSRATKNRLDQFMRMVDQRAKLVHSNLRISNKCAHTLACMIDDLLEKITDRTLDIYSLGGRKSLSLKDVTVAMQTLLPETLTNAAVARGAEAIAKRHGNTAALHKLQEVMNKKEFERHYSNSSSNNN